MADLIRQLNAKMANELARADATLRPFRNDFDRTPLPKNWQYDPTRPLPRNLAFIDAYEGGNAGTLGRAEARVAAEFARMNSEWVGLQAFFGRNSRPCAEPHTRGQPLRSEVGNAKNALETTIPGGL